MFARNIGHFFICFLNWSQGVETTVRGSGKAMWFPRSHCFRSHSFRCRSLLPLTICCSSLLEVWRTPCNPPAYWKWAVMQFWACFGALKRLEWASLQLLHQMVSVSKPYTPSKDVIFWTASQPSSLILKGAEIRALRLNQLWHSRSIFLHSWFLQVSESWRIKTGWIFFSCRKLYFYQKYPNCSYEVP